MAFYRYPHNTISTSIHSTILSQNLCLRLGLKNPENESLEVCILSNLLGAGTVGWVGIFTMFMISILEHESFGELYASQ